jgi:hypothetical protein
MKQIINVSFHSLIEMDPMELSDYLRTEVNLELPVSIDSKADMYHATEMMAKASSYICYFKEMETLTRAIKRQKKRSGCSTETADNLLGCEEIFETYKRIAEQYYEQISKMMTMKRLMLDECKILGRAT